MGIQLIQRARWCMRVIVTSESHTMALFDSAWARGFYMACEHMQTGADIFLNRRKDGKCKICRHEIYKTHYFANKEKVLEKARKYRAKNPDKVKKIKAKWVSEKKDRKEAVFKLPDDVKQIRVIYARKIRNLIAKINETVRAYRKYRSDVSTRYRNDERHSSGNCGS